MIRPIGHEDAPGDKFSDGMQLDHGDMVELCFFCPVKREVFRTDRWEASGCLTAVLDGEGNRHLQGSVTAVCPLCGDRHVFLPDELPCPLEAGVWERREL